MQKFKPLDRDEFFSEFSISEDYFSETGLNWKDLQDIYLNYSSLITYLEKEAEHIFSKLRDVPNVHSVRRRVKEPRHLIEKIIRKGKKYSEQGINAENYKSIVTDLIGIRVLHLFKDDWQEIHKEITRLWETKETPQVNIRRGDYNLETLRENIKDLNCDIILREHGYRSIHYLVGVPLSKDEEVLVEIQVRTVFEEAWSEIDHIIRYPYDVDNPVLTEYLAIFNRIVGSADEMGMFIKKLKGEVGTEGGSPRELDMKFK